MDDFVIINKSDLTIFETFCIIIQDSHDLLQKEKWFLSFLNSSEKQLYVKFINLNMNLHKLSNNQLIEQFNKDITRTRFQLNKNYHSMIINNYTINHAINHTVIRKIIKKHYTQNLSLFYKILFLCSQTSLAFIINKIHFSILSGNLHNYIIAELPHNLNNKQKRKMNIQIMLENNEVIIEKYLRIIQNNVETDTLTTVQEFKLVIYFKIVNDKINAIVNIKKLN